MALQDLFNRQCNINISFKKTRLTQLGLKYKKSELFVQAIQALDERHLKPDEQQKTRHNLTISTDIKSNLQDRHWSISRFTSRANLSLAREPNKAYNQLLK